jgi:hypothetical protein
LRVRSAVMVCTPWVDPDMMTLCNEDGLPGDTLTMAAGVASELLYWASGRQFPGVCTDTIRPCAPASRARLMPYDAGWWRSACHCVGPAVGLHCSCHSGHTAVRLPNTPVVAVSQVRVGGVAVTGFRIVDDRWLLRTDGGSWPCCQDLGLAATEPDTFEVVYTFGGDVPAPGLLAAEVLTCELAKGWRTGKCRLPQRLTTITREGVTIAVLDEFKSLADHRFGIWEIDAFLELSNPAGLAQSARVLLVDEFESGMVHRVR